MANEQRDGLDDLLDDALATYASQNPGPGIEQRVLHRIRTDGAWSWLPPLGWALPLIAMGLVLAGIVIWNDRVSAPVPSRVAIAAMGSIRKGASPLRRQPRSQRPAALPKQREFPIRAGLTHQERSLLAFVRSAPDEALRTFGEMPSIKIETIEISQITVEPLQVSDGGN